MKRILALLIAAFVILASLAVLASCGSDEDTSSAKKDTTAGSVEKDEKDTTGKNDGTDADDTEADTADDETEDDTADDETEDDTGDVITDGDAIVGQWKCELSFIEAMGEENLEEAGVEMVDRTIGVSLEFNVNGGYSFALDKDDLFNAYVDFGKTYILTKYDSLEEGLEDNDYDSIEDYANEMIEQNYIEFEGEYDFDGRTLDFDSGDSIYTVTVTASTLVFEDLTDGEEYFFGETDYPISLVRD